MSFGELLVVDSVFSLLAEVGDVVFEGPVVWPFVRECSVASLNLCEASLDNDSFRENVLTEKLHHSSRTHESQKRTRDRLCPRRWSRFSERRFLHCKKAWDVRGGIHGLIPLDGAHVLLRATGRGLNDQWAERRLCNPLSTMKEALRRRHRSSPVKVVRVEKPGENQQLIHRRVRKTKCIPLLKTLMRILFILYNSLKLAWIEIIVSRINS